MMTPGYCGRSFHPSQANDPVQSPFKHKYGLLHIFKIPSYICDDTQLFTNFMRGPADFDLLQELTQTDD